MVVEVVPPEYIPQRWDQVSGFIKNALDYAQGDYDIEHVRVYLTTGQWMLLIGHDEAGVHGAAAVQFFNRPASRVAFIAAIGGRLISNPDTFAQLKSICKQYGATHIEGAARESIARLWSRYGLAEKYRIVGVTL